MRFYVTYGVNTKQAQKFSVIEAVDERAARDEAMRVTNRMFSFLYDESGFAGQVEAYGLTEISLQPMERR